MILHLKQPKLQDEQAFMGMMQEWEQEGGRIHPGLLRLNGRSFTQWFADLQLQRSPELCPPGRIPQELFFLQDQAGRIFGAGSIRINLDEHMARIGGHLAYGIRPSARGKGYGKQQLRLLLEQCCKAGLDKVLITCLKENTASRAIILTCGGIYESDVWDDDGLPRERYWVHLAECDSVVSDKKMGFPIDMQKLWYHGTNLDLEVLREGSTITQWRELAEAFAMQPTQLEYADFNRPETILHNGKEKGILYIVDEPLLMDEDIFPHPRTSMDDGVEFLTRRPLKLKRID